MTSPIITGTSISGPMTAVKAWPEEIAAEELRASLKSREKLASRGWGVFVIKLSAGTHICTLEAPDR